MGTSLRAQQKHNTQLEIIKVAMGLFAEKGFDNVPVEAICERAGISRATFFNYFPQKDMILAAVGAARIETMRGLLADKLGGRRSLKLRHVISLFVDFAAENEELGSEGKDLFLQVLFRSIPRTPHVKLRKQFTAALAEVLAQVSLQDDPKVVAATMFSVYIGTTMEWMMDPDLKPGWLTKTLKVRLEVVAKER